jgi:putative flippase GtrA
LLAFALVGTAAFVVHFGVVSISVPRGVPPLGANVLGFLAAFTVSFVGHDRWSFPAARPRPWAALRRLFAVALLGFTINESLYALLLSSTHLDYRVALLVVLAVVAGSTLLLSKHWAFADEH